jgi:hypothetical protein
MMRKTAASALLLPFLGLAIAALAKSTVKGWDVFFWVFFGPLAAFVPGSILSVVVIARSRGGPRTLATIALVLNLGGILYFSVLPFVLYGLAR